MQPGLASRVVMANVDGFLVDVGVVAAEASDLLRQSGLGVRHQLQVTAIPQFVPVTDGARHAPAGRLEGVFGHQLRIHRRQVAVPIDDLAGVAVVDVVHGAPNLMVFVIEPQAGPPRSDAPVPSQVPYSL